MSGNPQQYCLESVKKHDYENFLATILLPSEYRNDALAVRAFNVELALVGAMTKEPLAGLMRLQFWRDTLEAIYKDNPRQQPVAMALHRAVRRRGLQKRWLTRLIDSREKLVHSSRFITIGELEEYVEESNASLYYLLLQCAGVTSVEGDHCASHLGKAEGVVKVLRGLPLLAPHRQIMLPQQIVALHGVTEESVVRGEDSPKLRDAVLDVASVANSHMKHAVAIAAKLPGPALPPLYPLVGLRASLARLERLQFNLFDKRWGSRDPLLPSRLLWARFRGKL